MPSRVDKENMPALFSPPAGRSASRLGGKEAEHMILAHLPYFWNSQSLLSRGQTCLAFSHREMQWKWKACCSHMCQSIRSCE